MGPAKYVETGRTLMKRNAVTNGLNKVTGKTEVLELKLDTDAVDDVGRLDCRSFEALGVYSRIRKCFCCLYKDRASAPLHFLTSFNTSS